MVDSATLYIVATPIGNLGDMTHRAIKVLQEVAIIAAEDTRHSQRLLQHYQINTPLLSLHDHNEKQRAERLVEKLQNGQSIALISDAGTPLISDPGYTLVSRCREAGIKVVPIPGPCAAVAALCAAGLPTDRFRFEGFLPVKEMARRASLASLQGETATVVFYEAPRRIRETLSWLLEELGEARAVVLAKELTKTFETFVAGGAREVLAWLDADEVHQKGEFVLMVGPAPVTPTEIPQEALLLLKRLAEELPLKKAAAITAEQFGLKKNALYQIGLTFNAET
ncbi:16S rRNA (cytidine(1402)-2'-O)-methyltransferase [Aliiglaciecola sp. CAU 1673]|uniref:16S rRNA (cytidine(1402)-2'-O)-methyltransferase n=1 Tax=Aliiglaciecola sp. CAU 1673 TaxID=3032595 RepID=UPI0023DCA42D|nr:16S rRNA (cytidine(1402)-2'-O)-methyltransferase [Aliiglaciecola sp. CAU 1673]MDF2178448.1 16S rRNA (cytidine(1402)-2'-O)-methyltransferase [Aliiglaciecola sp. CAU 1673]